MKKKIHSQKLKKKKKHSRNQLQARENKIQEVVHRVAWNQHQAFEGKIATINFTTQPNYHHWSTIVCLYKLV